MTARSKMNGHDIEYVSGDWVYSDTKESTMTQHGTRSCSHCKQYCTPEGHDACLGTLPGVTNACCGHGILEDTFVQICGGEFVVGETAAKIIEVLRTERNISNE